MTNDTIELGLRERKKRAVRRRLQLTALELVAEHGLCGVSVDDIAAASGVSPRTFFNYFATKEEALFAPDDDRLDVAEAAITMADPARGVWVAARDTLLAMMDETTNDLTGLRLRREILDREPTLMGGFLRATQSVQMHWIEALKDRFRTGPELPEGYIELVVAAVWTASGIALHLWSAGGHGEPIRDILADQLEQLAEGLARPVALHSSA